MMMLSIQYYVLSHAVIALDIFSNRCGSYKVVKVVHGNQSTSYCKRNRSDTTARALSTSNHPFPIPV